MAIKTINLRQEVEEKVGTEIARGGFEGSYTLTEHSEKPNFQACVDTQTLSNMKLSYNPEYEAKNPGKTLVVMTDLPKHEINHRKYRDLYGCPRNLENHVSRIVEPIASIIAPKGFGTEDVHYVANALEDTILHSDLGRKFRLEGINAFFQDVGESTPDKTFTPFYEAHVRLNTMLFGKKQDKRQLQRYFTRDEKTRKKILGVLQEFFEETGISRLKYSADNETPAKDIEQIRDFLNDAENWQKIADAYAKHFSKLMQPSYALPLPNHSGTGTKGREREVEEKEGNEFDKEMEKPEFKKQRIQKAYTSDSGVPGWMDNFEALDLLYQSLAQKLNIKVQTFTQEMEKPVFFYGTRQFDPDRDNLKHLGVRFDENGKVELTKRKWHENTRIPYKHNPQGFPQARFCLIDTSGSMARDVDNGTNVGRTSIIPWGDESKYHFALLGWYGFLEWLKQNHLLSQMGVGMANISDKTLIAEGLEKAKRLALKPQFGNTYIDSEKVGRIFEGRGNLVFTISDGDIINWEDIRNSFIQGAKNHYYFHLQIGGKNQASRDLEKAKLAVEYIRGNADLAKKVIDLTDSLYRGEK